LKSLPKDPENKGIKQIAKDVSRTFPEDKGLDKVVLKDVLESYTLRNPNIGYCQGLNFIVATLMQLGFSECESFWMFVQIVEHYTPSSYYNSMAGVILDQKVFDHVFMHKLQKVANHLERLGIESCLFTVQWFICMFSFNFDRDVVCLIWDAIFLHGHSISFSVGICALSIIKESIMTQKDFVVTLAVIEQGCRNISTTQMKSALNEKHHRISWKFIKKLRDMNEKIVIDDYNSRYAKIYTQDELISTIRSLCIDEGDCKQKILRTSGFFTFGCKLEAIDGYLDLCSYPKYINYPDFFHKNHLLGKKNHCCKHDEGIEEEIKLEEVIEEPLEFIRKSSFIGSLKRSTLTISNSFDSD
jgi:hypothetical protein